MDEITANRSGFDEADPFYADIAPALAPAPAVGENPRFDRLAAALAPAASPEEGFRRVVGEVLAARG